MVEHFQWLTPEASASLPSAKREEVALELADVLLYLVMLADKLGVDLASAAHRKMDLNEDRYPADAVPRQIGQARQPLNSPRYSGTSQPACQPPCCRGDKTCHSHGSRAASCSSRPNGGLTSNNPEPRMPGTPGSATSRPAW